MAGLARSTRMYMRFRVQYRDAEGRWRMVKSGPLTDSRWRARRDRAARRARRRLELQFRPPASGGAHVLRGVVSFEWRRGKRVSQRDARVHDRGRPSRHRRRRAGGLQRRDLRDRLIRRRTAAGRS